MDAQLLRAIQHYNARAAIGSSSMRGAGHAGVVESARSFLGKMELAPFGASSGSKFLSRLSRDRQSQANSPKGAQRWGLARKGLNIFLRGCCPRIYLRDAYNLARAENFFEVPLDSITAARLAQESVRLAKDSTRSVEESRVALPPWKTVRGLTAKTSAEYQAVATVLAEEKGIAQSTS